MKFKTKILIVVILVFSYLIISSFLIFEVRDNLFSRRNYWNFFVHGNSIVKAKTKILVPMGVNDNQKFQLRKIKIESTKLKEELREHDDNHLQILSKDSSQRQNNINRPELSSAFVNEQIKKAIEENKKRQAGPLYAPKRMTEEEIVKMLAKKNIELKGKLNQESLPDVKKLTESNAGRKKLSMEEIDTILKEKLPQEIYKKVLESYEKPSSGLLASHEMKFILRKYLPRDTYRNILFSLRAQGRPATPEEIEYAKKNNIPIQSAELDEDHL